MFRAVSLALALIVAWPSTSDAHTSATVLSARADASAIAQTNKRLIGVGWDSAPFTDAAMAPLRPHLARIDGSLERLYPKGAKLDATAFTRLARDIVRARKIGAEPVVILSYTPVWLADPNRPAPDRTKAPPDDPSVWRRLVTEVVTKTSALGVRYYEVWNEPDLPVFFQGLLHEFLEQIYRPSATAVRDVARRTKRPLRFGGCACFFADASWIVPMIVFARTNDLPLDFISWHHYGNTPFLGPDGAEPLGPPEFVALLQPLRQRNPVTNPSSYADQVDAVRSWRDILYADTDAKPELWIDEWNLSPGGFDRRHDQASGAAFQAATLIAFQRAGLDRAAVFRSVDPAYGPDVVPRSPELYGGWGLVGREGTIKPAWRAHRFFASLGRAVLGYTAPADDRLGVAGMLTRRSRDSYAALIANFQASADHVHDVGVRIDGTRPGRWSVTVTDVGGTSQRTALSSRGAVVVPVKLPAGSAVLVEIARV